MPGTSNEPVLRPQQPTPELLKVTYQVHTLNRDADGNITGYGPILAAVAPGQPPQPYVGELYPHQLADLPEQVKAILAQAEQQAG